jgi:hypothetical protein
LADIASDVMAFTNTPYFAPIVLIAIVGVVAWKLGSRLGNKVTAINRPEILRRKLIKTLSENRGKRRILTQGDGKEQHDIGIMSNLGYYTVGGKKLYLFLFSPILFFSIPQFWNKEVMIVSEDFFTHTEVQKRDYFLGKWEYLTRWKFWVLKSDYFIDNFSLIKLNLADSSAMDFIKAKLKLDELETESGVYLAQAMRLTNVDFSKAYQPTASDVELEKQQQASEVST